VQIPLVRQRGVARQSSPCGTHAPSLAVQRPSFVQPVDVRQSSLEPTVQRSPARLHLPCSTHAAPFAQSALDRRAHSPASAVQ